MTWNHRVISRKYETGETYYAIHEVYYDESGEPYSVTAMPSAIMEESVEDIAWTLERIQKCLSLPVLDYEEDFPDV